MRNLSIREYVRGNFWRPIHILSVPLQNVSTALIRLHWLKFEISSWNTQVRENSCHEITLSDSGWNSTVGLSPVFRITYAFCVWPRSANYRRRSKNIAVKPSTSTSYIHLFLSLSAPLLQPSVRALDYRATRSQQYSSNIVQWVFVPWTQLHHSVSSICQREGHWEVKLVTLTSVGSPFRAEKPHRFSRNSNLWFSYELIDSGDYWWLKR